MLRQRQRAITVVVLAICLAVAFAGEFWQASHIKATPQIHISANDATPEKPEEAIARYNKWLTYVTAVLAIATVGLGIGTIFQLRLARAEFIASHRPRLIIREVQRLTPTGAARNIELRYVVANIGSSEGEIVESHFELQDVRDGILRPLQPFEGANPIGHVILRPGSHIFREHGSRLSTHSLAVSRMIEVRERRRAGTPSESRGVYFRGFVIYTDKNGIRRRTSWAYDAETERFYQLDDPDYEYVD